MDDGGYVYTLVTVILLLLLLSVVVFYFQVSKPRLDDTVTGIRTDELHYFIEAVKKDFNRAASISGQRATAYAIGNIISSGTAFDGYVFRNCSSFVFEVNGSQAAIAELMLCGTVYGSSSGSARFMENNTLSDWMRRIDEFSGGLGFVLNMSLIDLKIVPLGSFNYGVIGTFETKAKDEGNLTLFYGNISTLAVVPIYFLEDPLYLVETGQVGLIPYFNQCESTLLVTGTTLDSWVNSNCYHSVEKGVNAPSFFDRLDGSSVPQVVYQAQAEEMAELLGLPDLEHIGLEAFVNLDEFVNYNVSVNFSRTWVDYLYWAGAGSHCNVSGMTVHPDFRLDYPHAVKYNPIGMDCLIYTPLPPATPSTPVTPPATLSPTPSATPSGVCPGVCDYAWLSCDHDYCGDAAGCDCWYNECNDGPCPCTGCLTRFTCCAVGEACDCDQECPPGVSCIAGVCGGPPSTPLPSTPTPPPESLTPAPTPSLPGTPTPLPSPPATPSGPVSGFVVDHDSVSLYERIPQYYLDEVKKMFLSIPGESHSRGYGFGLEFLEQQNPAYSVTFSQSSPPAYTDTALRVSNVRRSSSGWTNCGEEDWYTNSNAITGTRNHIDYCNSNNLEIAALGFGWCWDMTWHNSPGGGVDPVYNVRWAGASVGGPEGDMRWGLDAGDFPLTGNSVSMDTYLSATDGYRSYAQSQGYATQVFYTTGPVDGGGNTGESGYQRYLKNQRIRDHASADPDAILFDYADILAHNNAGQQNTVSWNSNSFPFIHSDNMQDFGGGYSEDGDHIGQEGALRLGKALWVLMAQVAGWDGTPACPAYHTCGPGESCVQGVCV